jgi:phosphogluconate dehydratase
MPLNSVVAAVTGRIIERSRLRRAAYLARIDAAATNGPHRRRLSCGNLAHGFAACGVDDKAALRAGIAPNIGIVNAYNDMLSPRTSRCNAFPS